MKVTENGLFFVGKAKNFGQAIKQLSSYPTNLTLQDFCAVATRDVSALEYLRVH